MATFPDLSTFDHYFTEASEPGSDAVTLTLPIRGRNYTWHAGDLSLWAMLKLQRLDQQITDAIRRREAGEEVTDQLALTTAEQRRLDLDLIGEANLQQMSDDGVRWAETLRVSSTLLTWHLRGETAAMETWAREGKEKPADPPARAASTKTAGSSTRKKPARRSGGGTSSRTGSSSKPTSTASTKST